MDQIRNTFGSRISALEVGETACDCKRLSLGFFDKDDLSSALERLRNNANPSVKYAKDTRGGEYTVETGDFLTRSKDLMVVIAVTRTA